MREGRAVSVIERTLRVAMTNVMERGRRAVSGRDAGTAATDPRRQGEVLRPLGADGPAQHCPEGRPGVRGRDDAVRAGVAVPVVLGGDRPGEVEDIAEAVRRHVKGGGAVYLLSRTLRHRAGLAPGGRTRACC